MEIPSRHNRVAVIGCGFVGTAVGQRFIADGGEVVATTTTPARCRELSEMGIHPVVARVDQVDLLCKLLADRDIVVLSVSSGKGIERYRQVYAQGAKNLVVALSRSPVRRIIYTSSTRVYCENSGGWVDETSATRAVDDASEALIQAEQTLLDGGMKMGATTSVLRLGGIHGPGRELTKRICAAAGSSRSDGDAFVNLVDVEDVVEVVARLVNLNHHGALNVTDGVPLLRRTLYDHELITRKQPPINWQPSPDGKPGKRVQNRRVCALLGMSFKTALTPPI